MGCLISRINKYNKSSETTETTIIIIEKEQSPEQMPKQLPPELLSLLHENNLEIQQKFYDVLNKDPSETDGNGFIYGFTKDNDYKWIKIGRTIQANPNKRVNQWKGDILFCQKTEYNKKIELLIHLLLKNRNVHRENLKTGGKEIEWFYFDCYLNIPKILAILIEYVEHHKNYTITMPSHVA